jgi:hypothetical protein
LCRPYAHCRERWPLRIQRQHPGDAVQRRTTGGRWRQQPRKLPTSASSTRNSCLPFAARCDLNNVSQRGPENAPSRTLKPRSCAQVHRVLYSRKWEARLYAGEALGHLARRVPHHSPGELADAVPLNAASRERLDGASNNISFGSFNVDSVLELGTTLYASAKV